MCQLVILLLLKTQNSSCIYPELELDHWLNWNKFVSYPRAWSAKGTITRTASQRLLKPYRFFFLFVKSSTDINEGTSSSEIIINSTSSEQELTASKTLKRKREREEQTRNVGNGSTSAEMAELHFDLVEESGCFIKRASQVGFILHQHVAVGFLKPEKKMDNRKHNLDESCNNNIYRL